MKTLTMSKTVQIITSQQCGWINASVYPLATTSGDLTPSSQRPSPCTVQTCTTLGWMQGTYSRPRWMQGTWPTVHPTLQVATHTCSPRKHYGCKGRIARGQALPLPDVIDLVVHHRENVLFLNPNTRVYQQSREVCNAYYHPQKTSHFRKLYSFRAHQDRPCGSKQICWMSPCSQCSLTLG